MSTSTITGRRSCWTRRRISTGKCAEPVDTSSPTRRCRTRRLPNQSGATGSTTIKAQSATRGRRLVIRSRPNNNNPTAGIPSAFLYLLLSSFPSLLLSSFPSLLPFSPSVLFFLSLFLSDQLLIRSFFFLHHSVSLFLSGSLFLPHLKRPPFLRFSFFSAPSFASCCLIPSLPCSSVVRML